MTISLRPALCFLAALLGLLGVAWASPICHQATGSSTFEPKTLSFELPVDLCCCGIAEPEDRSDACGCWESTPDTPLKIAVATMSPSWDIPVVPADQTIAANVEWIPVKTPTITPVNRGPPGPPGLRLQAERAPPHATTS